MVVDAHYNKLSKAEEQLIKELKAKKIPYLIVLNKIDAQQQLDFENFIQAVGVDRVVFVSAKENVGIEGLKEVIVNIAQEKEEISIYPNPFTDFLQISNAKNINKIALPLLALFRCLISTVEKPHLYPC